MPFGIGEGQSTTSQMGRARPRSGVERLGRARESERCARGADGGTVPDGGRVHTVQGAPLARHLFVTTKGDVGPSRVDS